MAEYVLSIDQGTTGSTVVVLDRSLTIRAKVNCEYPQIYPRPGWVEHDPAAIWGSVLAALGEALAAAGIAGSQIVAIGITNQRETTLLWDRRTGEPLHNAIVWQDRRTAEHCAALKAAGREELFRRRTGLVLDPYFSGTKLRWLLDHVDGARPRAERGELCFGTVDSYLVYRLTGKKQHVTDPSNASRTLLLDIGQCAWDGELAELLGVPLAVLPELRSSAEVYGRTHDVPGLRDGIPIAGMAGDQQAALFGQACFSPGDAKCTYGTGAFVLQNIGGEPVPSRHRLLTTVAWKLGDEVTYALEGSAFIAGAAVQWLRDGLGLFRSSAEIEALASSVPDAGGVIFVPALVGLGAPHWRAEARGLVCGITRGTTAAHLARATLEGIAFSVYELLEAMQDDAGTRLSLLRVDGGAAANDLLMGFQADLLGTAISRPRHLETTAMGAAFLAGLGVGFWSDKAEVAAAWEEERRFLPRLDEAEVGRLVAAWRAAVARA
ncbi:MAG: glycerol kinase GlpK [Deltaproteobacteria bacterium]|nr:glycerol kinase GlpK [Deltaproteobacteria bacterium]